MSIYVLRSDNLVKIGFSESIGERVQKIISSVPVPVEFVGHMPGGRDVEKHFHDRFSAHRFSGEWFVETEEMRCTFDAILTPNMPAIPRPEKKRVTDSKEVAAELFARVAEIGARRWPHLGKIDRMKKTAEEMSWGWPRFRDLHYGAKRIILRASEQADIERWIAPELAHDETDEAGA